MQGDGLAEGVWHPWWRWEECSYNMWGNVSDKSYWLAKAIAFTGDAELYGKWMLKVVDKWPVSCEHNLTKKSLNRKAWIGHAAAALAIQCPEDIVRAAWAHLSREQQIAANAKAQEAIDIWEQRNA